MVFLAWIIAGALLGGAACAFNGTSCYRTFALNVAAGIAGVLLAGWLLGLLIGASAFGPGAFGVGSLLVSLLGASVLQTIPHVVPWQGGPRTPNRPESPRHADFPQLETVYRVRKPG